MDATTMIFTMWIGSYNVRGQDDVFIGRALASDQSCQGIQQVRPTIDAVFEVLEDDAGRSSADKDV